METWIGGCLHSGNDDPATLTEGASYTLVSERDFGTSSGPSSASRPMPQQVPRSATGHRAADFGRAVAIAIRDEGAGGPAAAVLDPYGMRGFFGG